MTLMSTIRGKAPKPYDSDIAYLLSIISTWCYGEQQVLEQVLRRKSMGTRKLNIEPFTVRNPALPVDANGFLISLHEGFHVLSFRGTEPTQLVDMLTDALVEKHIWRTNEDDGCTAASS